MALVAASGELKATFDVGQDSTELKGVFLRKPQGSQAEAQGIPVDVLVALGIVV